MNLVVGNQLENYFLSLSTWIANLGVVPWLLFLAFLLFPIFTFLFDLLSLVTCVLDTIALLQLFCPSGPINYLRLNFLPTLRPPVKVLIAILTLCTVGNYANAAQTTEKTTILMSIGEHREVKVKKLKKFTITNPQVIGHKFKQAKQFIIKGKKLGFTELVIWTESKKLIYQVYVMAKSKQLKILHIAEMLKGMELDIELAGPLIIATGEVKEIKNYLFLKRLIKENKNVLIMKALISPKLRNEIIMMIYKRFFNSYEDNISCKSDYLTIRCQIPNHISNDFIKDLKKKYYLEFLRIRGSSNKKNYQVNIKFFRILNISSQDKKLGLSRLNSKVSELINANWENLIEGNTFNIEGFDTYIREISNHQISTILNKKTSFSTGVEIPYEDINTSNSVVLKKWKFAGVKINFEIQKNGNSYLLKYDTTKKSPSGGNQFTSSSNSSSITLALGDLISIYKSKFNFSGKEVKLLPYLSSIPFIGSIFKDNDNKIVNERIFAYVQITSENK